MEEHSSNLGKEAGKAFSTEPSEWDPQSLFYPRTPGFSFIRLQQRKSRHLRGEAWEGGREEPKVISQLKRLRNLISISLRFLARQQSLFLAPQQSHHPPLSPNCFRRLYIHNRSHTCCILLPPHYYYYYYYET